jgi:hypothetical protein
MIFMFRLLFFLQISRLELHIPRTPVEEYALRGYGEWDAVTDLDLLTEEAHARGAFACREEDAVVQTVVRSQ